MTSHLRSDFRRLASSVGVYATASLAQKGLAFLLIPVYTRFIQPDEYGVLELLTAFSTVAFGLLALGLPAAIMKTYHRDTGSAEVKARVLSTANLIGLPILLVGSALLFLLAEPISQWLFESGQAADLLRIMVFSGILSTAVLLLLAGLRAEERATAYSSVVLLQFLVAMALNIVFVVQLSMGVRGVLIGNLISHFVSLPVAMWLVSRRTELTFEPRLVRPLLTFGLLVVPGVLTGWINNLSDRYILNLFGQLDEVAVYGIGYKFGMVIQFLIVWPFQLAWPALAFSISNRAEHKATYSRVLTYLTAILGAAVVALSVLSRFVVPVVVGKGYEQAYRVVPYVALGYAFTGVYFCLSPGIHVAGKTRYLPVLLGVSASVNIALNFALIPHFGMMGAAAATTVSFLVSASGAWILTRKVYPVEYEYSRLFKIAVAGAVSYMMALLMEPQAAWAGVLWYSFWGLVSFPLLLLSLGFFRPGEISKIKQLLRNRFFLA